MVDVDDEGHLLSRLLRFYMFRSLFHRALFSKFITDALRGKTVAFVADRPTALMFYLTVVLFDGFKNQYFCVEAGKAIGKAFRYRIPASYEHRRYIIWRDDHAVGNLGASQRRRKWQRLLNAWGKGR